MPRRAKLQLRPNPSHGGQCQHFEAAEVGPAALELKAPHRQVRRSRLGGMVIHSCSPPITMPQSTMLRLASVTSKFCYLHQWPMPLTMPAALTGIQSLCNARTLPAIALNARRSVARIKLTPWKLCGALSLRSSYS